MVCEGLFLSQLLEVPEEMEAASQLYLLVVV